MVKNSPGLGEVLCKLIEAKGWSIKQFSSKFIPMHTSLGKNPEQLIKDCISGKATLYDSQVQELASVLEVPSQIISWFSDRKSSDQLDPKKKMRKRIDDLFLQQVFKTRKLHSLTGNVIE